MNKFFRVLIVSGLALLCFAAITATSIPGKTKQDFDEYVARRGGSMTHSQTFPDTFMLASTLARSLNNFWIGGTGLVFLAFGLAGTINSGGKVN